MNSPGRCLLVLCVGLATCATGLAQPAARLIVDQWRVEDGLPQDTVTSIAQDDRGYLWIATRKGLARFDGRPLRRSRSRRETTGYCEGHGGGAGSGSSG